MEIHIQHNMIRDLKLKIRRDVLQSHLKRNTCARVQLVFQLKMSSQMKGSKFGWALELIPRQLEGLHQKLRERTSEHIEEVN